MNRFVRFITALSFSLIIIFSLFGCAQKEMKAIFIVDGVEYAVVTVGSIEEFAMPEAPKKDGFIFSGWYLNENGSGGVFSVDALVSGGGVYAFAKWGQEHIHTAGEPRMDKAPTCFEDGITVTECSTCGHTMSTGVIDKLAHEPSDWSIVKASTCIAEGERQRGCNLCGAVVETEKLPLAEHTAGAESVATPSGCETKGLAVTKCSVCDEVIAERELDALGHTAGDEIVITPDECDAMIVGVTKCTACEKVISERELGLLGHTPGTETVKTPAGCETAGIAETKCAVCNITLSERTLDPIGHAAGEESVKIPSGCETKGLAVTKCSVCDKVIAERELDALGHAERVIPRVEPTETRDGLTAGVECSRCFEILTAQERIPAEISGCEAVLDGFTLSDTVFTIALSSDYEYFYINDYITVNEAASFVISKNADGSGAQDPYSAPLAFGYNTYYVTVTFGEDSLVYTLSIYRRKIVSVTFETKGSSVGFILLDEGGVITDVPVSTLAGYDFLGWDIDLTLPITEDVTATAQFAPRSDTPYTVNYYTYKDGEYSIAHTESPVGTTDTAAEIPAFGVPHYAVNAALSDSGKIISGDGALVIEIYLDLVQYSVRFEVGHPITMEKVSVTALTSYTPPAPPEIDGYRFVRWLYNGKEWTGTDSMTSDVYLIAEWVRLASVSFETSEIEGLSLDPITVEVGGAITTPIELPSTEDMAVAFYLNGSPFVLGYDIVTGDMTLVAKWVTKHVTVTFESKGTGVPEPMTVEYGSVIDSVPIPVRGTTYSFEGWYVKGSDIRWIPGETPVTSDITLEAKWSIMTPPDIWT